MRIFSSQDVIDYYDNTEPHYRMFWKFEQTLGLHYGIWDDKTRSLSEAIMNNNVQLAVLGEITSADNVLDAGCGVGGSAIYLAKNLGCKVTGITLSGRQAGTAANYAEKNGVSERTEFLQMDYTATTFKNDTFDVIWALESMQTASQKSEFFREAARVLKPGGRLLIADLFKAYPYNIDDHPSMRTTLHGWAISDLLTGSDFQAMASEFSMEVIKERDVTKEIAPTVRRLFGLVPAGFLGTVIYNTFVKKASYFSRVHYKTYFAQYVSYRKKLWGYKLYVLQKK